MNAPRTPVLLAVRDLAKRWGPGSQLRSASFDVAAGRVVAVRGRSGSGKSTLLALLSGWCEPDGGTIELDGVAVDLSAQPWHRVAVVPQVLALVPELTVRENVALGVVAGAVAPVAPLDGRVDEVLAALDLATLADRFPDEVSMGQQQRAAVGRAVAGVPALVLADEPTSHQDGEHATAVASVLRAAAALGSGVLVASHDPLVVAQADGIVDLDV